MHKFKFNRQEYLMVYRAPTPERREAEGIDIEWLLIDFYQVGSVAPRFYLR